MYSPRPPELPPRIPDIERDHIAKIFGVMLAHNCRFSSHVLDVVTVCSQHVFMHKAFENKGLVAHQLNIIFDAVILSRLLYALPAWGGFLSASDILKINTVLRKCFNPSNMAVVDPYWPIVSTKI